MKTLLDATFVVRTYDIMLITPTLLVGAHQGKRELRGASFRGAIRWWFRLLGGTPTEERELFGGIGTPTKSSKIIIRCKAKSEDLKSGGVLREEQNTPSGYLSFFAERSQKKQGDEIGPRVKPGAYFMPGSKMTLEVVERHSLTSLQRERLNEAIEAMICFGSIGYRSTRTYGALAPLLDGIPGLSRERLLYWSQLLERKGIYVRTLSNEHISDWTRTRDILAEFLKALRASDESLDGKGAVSALGAAMPKRVTSALRLRPLLLSSGCYMPVVIYSDNACDVASIWDKHLKDNPRLMPIT